MAPEGISQGYTDLQITFDGSDGFVIDGLGQPWLLGPNSGVDHQRTANSEAYAPPGHRAPSHGAGPNPAVSLPHHLTSPHDPTDAPNASRDPAGASMPNHGSMYMGYPGSNHHSLAAANLASSNMLGALPHSGPQEYSHYCYVNPDTYDGATVRPYFAAEHHSSQSNTPTTSQPAGGSQFPSHSYSSSYPQHSHPYPGPPSGVTHSHHPLQNFNDGGFAAPNLPLALSPNIPPPSPTAMMNQGVSLPGVGMLAGHSHAYGAGGHGHPGSSFLSGPAGISMTYSSYHDRPYPCTEPGCELRFVRSSHVKRHVDTVHRHLRPYQCKFGGCGKYFSRSDNLKQHEKTHQRSP
ncbi:hypothetical protein H4R34_000647 [Dimargaris verticillata]|uniref:C2H2-type domain-containing protein n=1 Tax=Dimargaris verticillata TaxID=2761393 RepID=A0A9W8BBF0_9FUNG|nr:hypothetical protein H4R34_000647 [Dimargaris verticillata]